MIKKYIVSSLMIMAFLMVPVACFAANTSSCVNCHTSDAIMKSLYKAPVMPPGEAEGEG